MEYSKIKTSALSLQPMVWRRLRAYLWGIETACHTANFSAQKALRAYLWGIETYQYCYTLWFLICCEPTYEELKPVNVRYLGFLGRSCEPTYEELKLGRIDLSLWELRKLRAYLWGIETPFLLYVEYSTIISCEPTYEELKLEPLNEREGVVKSLRAYLWGIETFISYSFWGKSP